MSTSSLVGRRREFEMRKALVAMGAGAIALIAPMSPAGATPGGGCEHGVTAHAHDTVPHDTEGNGTAHENIPYCPPHDAPRHTAAAGGDHAR